MRALGLGLVLILFTGCVGAWGPDVPRPAVYIPPVYVAPAPIVPYYYSPYWYDHHHGHGGHHWRRGH